MVFWLYPGWLMPSIPPPVVPGQPRHLERAGRRGIEAHRDLVVLLGDPRLVVPAQAEAQGGPGVDLPFVLHEEAVVEVAPYARRVDAHEAVPSVEVAEQEGGEGVARGGVPRLRIALRESRREVEAAIRLVEVVPGQLVGPELGPRLQEMAAGRLRDRALRGVDVVAGQAGRTAELLRVVVHGQVGEPGNVRHLVRGGEREGHRPQGPELLRVGLVEAVEREAGVDQGPGTQGEHVVEGHEVVLPLGRPVVAAQGGPGGEAVLAASLAAPVAAVAQGDAVAFVEHVIDAGQVRVVPVVPQVRRVDGVVRPRDVARGVGLRQVLQEGGRHRIDPAGRDLVAGERIADEASGPGGIGARGQRVVDRDELAGAVEGLREVALPL